MATPTFLLPISASIAEAWHKTRGSKGTFWAALIIVLVLSILMGIIQNVLKDTILNYIISLIIQLINFLLQIGILYIGIERARDLPINYRLMFHTFELSTALRVIGTYILQVLILIPFTLLIGLPLVLHNSSEFVFWMIAAIGLVFIVYLSVRMFLAVAFALDRKDHPLRAIRHSFQATRGNFWRIIAILMLQLLIIIISAIPLGIGLIWTLPFTYVLFGLIYKNLQLNVQD